MKIKVGINDLIYLIAFAVFMFASILSYSTLGLSRTIIHVARIIVIAAVFSIEMQQNKQKLKTIILFMLFIVLSVLIKMNTDRWSILDIGMLILGAKNVKFINIAKVYRAVASFTLILIIMMFLCGIIDENLFYRGSIARHSFGFIYATDLAALVFYILLSDLYIAKSENKIMFYRYIIYIILSMLIYFLCDARLGTICILMLIPADIYINHSERNLMKIEKFLLTYSVPIFTVLMITITRLYIVFPTNSILEKLDSLLSYRLYYSKMGVLLYGYKLYGQKIEMRGAGSEHYFYIDSSYMNIALIYGVIVLLLVCFIFVSISRKKVNNGEILLPVIILLIAINSFVGQQMLDIAYDIFLLAFLADTKEYKINLKRILRRLKNNEHILFQRVLLKR